MSEELKRLIERHEELERVVRRLQERVEFIDARPSLWYPWWVPTTPPQWQKYLDPITAVSGQEAVTWSPRSCT